MIKLRDVAIVACLFALTIVHPAGAQTVWKQAYPPGGHVLSQSCAVTADGSGNVYVTGLVAATHCATVKYSRTGTQLWAVNYTGLSHAEGHSIAVDSSGNVYVTGVSSYLDASHRVIDRMITLKYDSSGNQLWVGQYAGAGNGCEGWSVAVDASGNTYVTGGEENGSNTITIKYNSSGVQQWVSTYSPGGEGFALKLDPSANVFVAAANSVIKYNSSGVQQWVTALNGSPSPASAGQANYSPLSLAVDSTGNIVVAAKALTKYNTNGVQQWAISTPNGGAATQISLDGSDNIYVVGVGYANVTKYNSSGTQQWSNSYSGTTFNGLISVAVDNLGGVYVTGTVPEAVAPTDDVLVIKYNSSGVQQWVNLTPDFGFGSNLSGIAVDNLGDAFVLGLAGTGPSTADSYSGYITLGYN